MLNFKKNKNLSRMAVAFLILSLVMLSLPFNFVLATTARLTAAKDTLTTLKRSGTGAIISGYTESTNVVKSAFQFSTTTAGISWDPDGSGATATATISLISDGNLNASSTYTGEEVAAAIKFALENKDGDANDTYIVTYNATSSANNVFSIMGSGGNTNKGNIDWVNSSASSSLGFATGSSGLLGVSFESARVSFGVASSTGQFSLTVDNGTAEIVSIRAGGYTTSTIIAEINSRITSAATTTYSSSTTGSSYAKFRITSNSTGVNSRIDVSSVVNSDFLPIMKMVGDKPVDGAAASGLVAANHTIVFTLTTAVAVSQKVVITFPSGFTLPSGLDFTDMDFSGSTLGEATLAAAAADNTIGVGVSGQAITFTLDNDTTTLAAGETITIEIGNHATAGVVGNIQIVNPTVAGLYQITLETQTAASAVIDNAYVGVYIVGDDSVVLTATVDPTLNFELLDDNAISFCSLEPNTYHKVGGSLPASGSVLFAGVTVNSSLDGGTIAIDDVVYELDHNASSSVGDLTTSTVALVSIVDNSGAYLTTAQVASNLARAINNSSSRTRANVDGDTNTTVNVLARSSGTAGNSYVLNEQVSDANLTLTRDSDGTFVNGFAAYHYKDNDGDWEDDNGDPAASVHCTDNGNSIVISTNAVSGYVLTAKDAGFRSDTSEVADWTDSSDFGFGIRAKARSSIYGTASTTNPVVAAFRHTSDDPEPLTTSATNIVSNTNAVALDIIAIEYMVRIGTTQEAGEYTDTVTYVVTATY